MAEGQPIRWWLFHGRDATAVAMHPLDDNDPVTVVEGTVPPTEIVDCIFRTRDGTFRAFDLTEDDGGQADIDGGARVALAVEQRVLAAQRQQEYADDLEAQKRRLAELAQDATPEQGRRWGRLGRTRAG